MAFTTRSSLLARLRDDGDEVWGEFTRAYTPILMRFAERLGLQGQDVDEVVQGVLVDFFQARQRFTYDRGKGRFRDYLKKAVVSKLGKLLRQARRAGTPVEELPEPLVEGDLEQRWEDEYRQHVLREALALVRAQVEPRTYQAFDLYALQGMDARKVARFLGVSVSVVYTCKNRVLERLRPLVQELMEE
jgi:RNA polymerase sigma-70 factor (ECF subfamily)